MEQVKVKKQRNFSLNSFLKYFFIASVSGLAVWVIVGVVLGCVAPNVDEHILYVFSGNIPFSDFAETLSYAICPNPYTGEYGISTFYPPISFLIFYPFALICLEPLNNYSSGAITLEQLSSNPLFILSFVLYYLINLAIILYIAAKFSKLKGQNLFFLLGILFCFGPLLFEFIRANNTLTVCTLSLLFFYLNNSEKRWQRELSYVCLAGAICMKIYPALMIFYLIYKEKRFEKLFSVLKTLGYTLVLLFIPFLFIEGGFSNIIHEWNNFTGFSGSGASALSLDGIIQFIESLGPTQWTTNISIETVVFWFCELLSLIFGGADMSLVHSLLSTVLRYGLLLCAAVLPFLGFKSGKNKEFVTLAVGSYLLFPGVCNGYCMTLMMIPFLFMVKDWDNMKFSDKVLYTVCFAIVANPVFFSFGIFIPSSIATIVLVVKSIVDIIIDVCHTFKKKKPESVEDEKQEKIVEKQQVENENVSTFFYYFCKRLDALSANNKKNIKKNKKVLKKC